MCQAYEGEARYMQAREDAEMQRRYKAKGRAAWAEGQPREYWKVDAVPYQEFREGDDPEKMYTEAWWMNHWFDGPLIKAWLAGWDESNRKST